jgi:hypothetical protein
MTRPPEFASTVIFELYQSNEGDHFVKLRYNFAEQNLHGCVSEGRCYLEGFEELIKVLSLDDFSYEGYC